MIVMVTLPLIMQMDGKLYTPSHPLALGPLGLLTAYRELSERDLTCLKLLLQLAEALL